MGRSPQTQSTTRSRRSSLSGDPPIVGHRLSTLLARHAIEHQDTVKMIEFVLIHARLEFVRFTLNHISIKIESSKQYLLGPHDFDVEPRN
jgi:hypothetical protein